MRRRKNGLCAKKKNHAHCTVHVLDVSSVHV
jgi:hypothetical protein